MCKQSFQKPVRLYLTSDAACIVEETSSKVSKSQNLTVLWVRRKYEVEEEILKERSTIMDMKSKHIGLNMQILKQLLSLLQFLSFTEWSFVILTDILFWKLLLLVRASCSQQKFIGMKFNMVDGIFMQLEVM